MNGARTKAITTLVRWRKFEESRVSYEFQSVSELAKRSADAVVAVDGVIEQIHNRRSQLHEAENLDLARIRLVAQIEESAWEQLQNAEQRSAYAEERRLSVLALHNDARARTRVCQARLYMAQSASAEFEEKQLFDWMADIYQAGRTSHD